VGLRRGLTKLEIISGVLLRKESVTARKELDNLLRDGVPKKLRLGDCTLLRMSIDCLSKEREKEEMLSDVSRLMKYINYSDRGLL
jgi:hypothetical protein